MRVYCVSHSLGFTAPQGKKILCERGHELDNGFPQSVFWEYCCDCQTFIRSNFAKGNKAAGECLVCDRRIARRYVCHACHVVSYESDNPARGKLFSIKTKGSPQPACPGCASNPGQKLRQHVCEVLDTAFATPRPLCPFCQEDIPLPVSFPILAADFFREFKGEKITATHNPLEWELVGSEAGEFVVITRGNETNQAIALPQVTSFRGPEDFTNSIKDYYDCPNAIAGDVIILIPAAVKKTDGGWKISEVGRLEIRSGNTVICNNFHQSNGHTPTLSPSQTRICLVCNSPAKDSHKFCKTCGAGLPPQEPGAPVPNNIATEWQPPSSAAEVVSAGTVPVPGTSTTPAGPTTTPPVSGSFGSMIKILGGLAVAVVVLLIWSVVLSKKGTIALTTENELESAIARGSIFSTAGAGAHDYYNKLKQEGASASTLARYNEKLMPLLTARPQQMMNDLVSNLESAGSTLPEWQDAQRAMEWASELSPADKTLAAKAAFCRGRVAYLLERWDDATAAWTQANRLDPSWALPVNGIGLIFNIKKDYPTARTYLKEAIRLAPTWAVPYNNMGTSYFYEKNYAQAESYYQQARDRAPQWARPYAWLGDIAAERKDYCHAREMYQESLNHAVEGMSNWNPQRVQRKVEEAAAKCTSVGQYKQRIYFDRGATTATVTGTSAESVLYVI